MKYEVKMSCGHTETIQLFGKTADRERRIDNGLRNLIFSLLNIISHKVPYDNYILTFINAVFFLLRTKKAS